MQLVQIGAHLAPVIPLWIHTVVDYFGFKLLSSNCDNRVWVWFTFTQDTYVLFHQMFGFKDVYP